MYAWLCYVVFWLCVLLKSSWFLLKNCHRGSACSSSHTFSTHNVEHLGAKHAQNTGKQLTEDSQKQKWSKMMSKSNCVWYQWLDHPAFHTTAGSSAWQYRRVRQGLRGNDRPMSIGLSGSSSPGVVLLHWMVKTQVVRLLQKGFCACPIKSHILVESVGKSCGLSQAWRDPVAAICCYMLPCFYFSAIQDWNTTKGMVCDHVDSNTIFAWLINMPKDHKHLVNGHVDIENHIMKNIEKYYICSFPILYNNWTKQRWFFMICPYNFSGWNTAGSPAVHVKPPRASGPSCLKRCRHWGVIAFVLSVSCCVFSSWLFFWLWLWLWLFWFLWICRPMKTLT